jgi:molecular chaperone DnaK
LGDKVSAEDKSKAEAASAELKQALEGGDVENIKAKTEALKQVAYKIAEEVYKQNPQAGAEQGAAGPGPDQNAAGNDNTKTAEDVDYEVVDDDK